MQTDTPKTSASPAFSSFIHTLSWMLLVVGAVAVVGCDSADPADEPEVADVVISPDSASLAVGEQVDFSAVALDASGDPVPDADLDIEWISTDTTVFSVGAGGVATGQDAGTAFCSVVATSRLFTGRDSAFVSVF